MKATLPIFVLLIAFCLFSCGTKERTIVVRPVIVSDADILGYVTRGSSWFDYTKMEKGYAIYVMAGKHQESVTYCPVNKLDKTIELIKYELHTSDSLSKTIKP